MTEAQAKKLADEKNKINTDYMVRYSHRPSGKNCGAWNGEFEVYALTGFCGSSTKLPRKITELGQVMPTGSTR